MAPEPFYADAWLTILGGDCRDVLPTLEADSVDCIVTSPPYWGLRDYGTARWSGGDEDCDHKPPPAGRAGRPLGAFHGGSDEFLPAAPYRDVCGRCGATRQDSQLGLEPTPEEYVANLVAVFRELRRVLKPSGTCWLNLGDSYAGSWGARGRGNGTNAPRPDLEDRYGTDAPNRAVVGLKPKDLVGIPWRVAFALQADGWYLRSDIIWAKPNPMPESVTDRPTKAHEYLFLLAKSERYYYDAAAIAEQTESHASGNGFARPERISGGLGLGDPTPWVPKPSRRDEWGRDGNPVAGHVLPGQGYAQHRPRESVQRGGFNGKTEALADVGRNSFRAVTATRNRRSVWTVATRPYPGAHFAVFPPALVEPCILAGTPAGGVVLDPFAGSGTVGLVAAAHSRRAVLIDLNPAYLAQALRRNAQTTLGLGVQMAQEVADG